MKIFNFLNKNKALNNQNIQVSDTLAFDFRNSSHSNQALSNSIIPYRYNPKAADITQWRSAYIAATAENPNYTSLFNIYQNILLDPHLYAVVESRIQKILSSKFEIYNSDGSPNVEISDKLQSYWFWLILRYIAEALFWGHSLIEIFIENDIPIVKLINRYNVIPPHKIVKIKYDDEKGYDISLPQFYNNYTMVSADEPNCIGLLYPAAPLVIFKKYNINSWAEFNERFGIPFRALYTPYTDDNRQQQLGQILASMSTAAWAVFKEGEKLDFHQPSIQGANTFNDFIDRLNRETSKLILGQTATTENSATGTYGSIKIMNEVTNDRYEADRNFVKFIVNSKILPKLTALGYISDNLVFDWNDSIDLSPKEYIDMITALSVNYIVDPKFITEKTGIPVSLKNNSSQIEIPNIQNSSKKKALIINHPKYPINKSILNSFIPDDFFQNILKEIFNDNIKFSSEYYSKLADIYFNKVASVFKLSDNDTYDHWLHAAYQANIFQFSAAKSLALCYELNQLAKNAPSFHQFQLDAKPLVENYNTNWLRTEYDTALSTAVASSNYYNNLKNKDTLPYWQYQTIGDNHVREAHQKLNGLIYPADSPVWDTIYPPNGWNCRCEVIALHEIPTNETLQTDVNMPIDLLKNTKISPNASEFDRMKKYAFNFNRAKTATAFAASNFYVKNFFKQKLGVKDFYGSNSFKWDNLNKTNLPKLQYSYKNNDEAKNNLLQKLDNNNRIIFKDYLNRAINLTKETIVSHLDNSDKYKERYKFVEQIPLILQNPDEIWIEGYQSEESYTFNYIKLYSNEMISVYVQIKNGQPLRIKTFMENNNDNNRKGILVKKFKL